MSALEVMQVEPNCQNTGKTLRDTNVAWCCCRCDVDSNNLPATATNHAWCSATQSTGVRLL